MSIKHKHHIVPKHMGGTDEPSNLIELTIQEHAEAHKDLWQKYGKLQDKVAYLMLSGKTEEGERERIELARLEQLRPDVRLKMSEYAKNRTPEHRNKLVNAHRGKVASEEAKQKMSESARNRHKSGVYWQSYSSEQQNYIVEHLTIGRKKKWAEVSADERKKISLKMNKTQIEKGSWKNGVEAARMANKGRKIDKDVVRRRTEALKKFYQTPEGKEMLRLRGLKRRENNLKKKAR